jgi:hypothetical protein
MSQKRSEVKTDFVSFEDNMVRTSECERISRDPWLGRQDMAAPDWKKINKGLHSVHIKTTSIAS